MKKLIMSLLDKKTNRLSRLNEFRRVESLTTESVGNFEIEISPKALEKLKKSEHIINFSFEHDFGIEDKTKEMYWVRVDGEYPKKNTDFSYLATGQVKNSQHSGISNWGVGIKFSHIDIACNWGQLNALVEMIAKWIDKKYGDDCGFKDKWPIENMKLDFIKNKKS